MHLFSIRLTGFRTEARCGTGCKKDSRKRFRPQATRCIVFCVMAARLPQALSDRLAAQFGPSAVSRMLSAFTADRLPSFRANILKTDDAGVMDVLREEGIAYERVRNIPHAFFVRNRKDRELLEHRLNQEGKIYMQGIASMLPPLVLDAQPGETVLDLCAAPGSKTSQIAAMMKNQGRLMACERDEIRYQKLLNTMRIQGATMVETLHIDATFLHKQFPETFDRVLADVPCSAEGRINLTDPRSHHFWSDKNSLENAKLQRRILKSAVGCLKPGGTLVYSTCTLAPAENEQMVDWVLAEFPEMKTEAFILPLQDLKIWPNKSVSVLPTKEREGFFVAKFKKKPAAL